MDIPASLVKQLREMTDAGMMECKKALVETNGDLERAVELLRQKGLSKAAKKADRVAAEGTIRLEVNASYTKASMVEINSETDFVAKNDNFKDFGNKTLRLIADSNINTIEELKAQNIEGSVFEEYLKAQIAKIGENIVVRRFVTINAQNNTLVNGYLHSNGRVGAIIALGFKKPESKNALIELSKNLCMHAAAMKPQVIDCDGFEDEFIKSEKIALIAEIQKENEELARLGKPLKKIPVFVSKKELSDSVLSAQEAAFKEELKAQKKPQNIWDRIIPGLMERFIADNTILDQRLTLLGQFFVLDDKKTIAQVLASKSAELNDEIHVLEYKRFELGEGVEKKVEDFAAEVASQMQ